MLAIYPLLGSFVLLLKKTSPLFSKQGGSNKSDVDLYHSTK